MVALPTDRRRRARRRRWCPRRSHTGSNRGCSRVQECACCLSAPWLPTGGPEIVSKKRRPHWSPSRPASPTSRWPSHADRNEPRARHRASSSAVRYRLSNGRASRLSTCHAVLRSTRRRRPRASYASPCSCSATRRTRRAEPEGPHVPARSMIRPASDPRMNRKKGETAYQYARLNRPRGRTAALHERSLPIGLGRDRPLKPRVAGEAHLGAQFAVATADLGTDVGPTGELPGVRDHVLGQLTSRGR